MAVTMYQKRMAARRRSGGIERLVEDYQRGINDITMQYEQSFANYQKDVTNKMAPYDAAVARYNQDLKAYQAAVNEYNNSTLAGYQDRLDAYNSSLENYYSTFVMDGDYYATWTYGSKNNTAFRNVGNSAMIRPERAPGNFYVTQDSDGVFLQRNNPVRTVQAQFVRQGKFGQYLNPETGQPIFSGFSPQPRDRVGSDYYISGSGGSDGYTINYFANEPTGRPGSAPSFNAKAPTAPTAPELPEFDDTEFEQRRAQLDTTYKRELGERRGARMSAVSRRSARPLLQGA